MARTRSGGTSTGVQKTLGEIAAAFNRLGDQLAQLGATSSAPSAAPVARRSAAALPSGKKKQISPKRKVALQFQGAYMAAVRSLSDVNKKKIKKLRSERGVEAAIAAALRLNK